MQRAVQPEFSSLWLAIKRWVVPYSTCSIQHHVFVQLPISFLLRKNLNVDRTKWKHHTNGEHATYTADEVTAGVAEGVNAPAVGAIGGANVAAMGAVGGAGGNESSLGAIGGAFNNPIPTSLSSIPIHRVLHICHRLFTYKEQENLLNGFTFSGALCVDGIKYGISVAHPFGDNLPQEFYVDCYDKKSWCVGGHGVMKFNEVTTPDRPNSVTADLCFLRLRPEVLVDNSIRCPGPDGRNKTYRLKLNRDEVQSGTPVMIRNKNGDLKNGEIVMHKYFVSSGNVAFRNVLGITKSDTEREAITIEGDSGCLVTSCPEQGSDTVTVFGVTFAVMSCKCVTPCHCSNKSMTLASNLSLVLEIIAKSPEDRGILFPGIAEDWVINSIDFAPSDTEPQEFDSGLGL